MNSLLKSVGKLCLAGTLVGPLGCSSDSKQQDPPPSDQVREELAGEISLRKDREELDELRKAIPEEKKQANDETALVTQLMVENKIKPSELQRRFQELAQRRRASFRKKVEGLRT